MPMVLWTMLWAGVQPGNIADFLNPANKNDFFLGFRALLPLAAAWAATVIIIANLAQQRPRGFRFFGPLGLTVVYGLVGIVAAFLSPDTSTA